MLAKTVSPATGRSATGRTATTGTRAQRSEAEHSLGRPLLFNLTIFLLRNTTGCVRKQQNYNKTKL
jgi:hypothetical protein